jgi:hypothetical protein
VLQSTAVHLQRLDLLEALGELLPIVHDDSCLALLCEELGHLLHLLLALLNTVDTNVANEGNASTHGSSGAALAVLDGDSILVGNAELLAGKVVDGGVGLAGGLLHGSGCAEDVLVLEVVVDSRLLDTGDNAGLGRGADNGHRVALLLSPLKLLGNTRARLALLAQLGSDGAELAVNISINLLGGHGEAMLLLETDEHATEVVANKVFEELVDSVSLGLAPLLKDLVGQVGASLEGKTLRQAEGVVAVEQNVLDLLSRRWISKKLRQQDMHAREYSL